jgi:hypothetical protein
MLRPQKLVMAALGVAVIALATGCASTVTVTKTVPASSSAAPLSSASSLASPSANLIAQRMGLDRQPGYVAYTATTDPNHLLGRQGEYTSKVNWGSDGTDQTAATGGSIEVFADAADAQARLQYLQAFKPPFGDGYDYLTGTALLRLAAGYTPTQAATLKAAFTGAVKGGS